MTGENINPDMKRLSDKEQKIAESLLHGTNATTVEEFLNYHTEQILGVKLKFIQGNTNTAMPTYVITPDECIYLYISSRYTKCGKKQMLYWYFKTIYDKSLQTHPCLIGEKGKINLDLQEPPIEEMDMHDPAMYKTKILLKILK